MKWISTELALPDIDNYQCLWGKRFLKLRVNSNPPETAIEERSLLND